MPIDTSIESFRQKKTNCAQSILIGFKEVHAVSDQQIDEARGLGGGRAEAGRCGALHASLLLETDSDRQDQIRQAFRSKAGAETCKEIRRQKILDCAGCVELAARLLAGQDHA